MEHVLWIGGPPGAGKTTVARRLARRHGLRLYAADTRTWAHRDRALADGHDAAHRWEAMAPAERWRQPSPDALLAMSLHRERGAMVLDDLRALPEAPLVVAEGSPLPPSAVAAGHARTGQALWLIPTAALQQARLTADGTTGGQARLAALLRTEIAEQARAHGAPVLVVDGTRDVGAMLAEVERHFAAALGRGPRARTAGERRALLREANAAIVAQVRGRRTRPWATADPDTAVRAFACECGDPGCEAELFLPVAAAAAGPVHAPGHAVA